MEEKDNTDIIEDDEIDNKDQADENKSRHKKKIKKIKKRKTKKMNTEEEKEPNEEDEARLKAFQQGPSFMKRKSSSLSLEVEKMAQGKQLTHFQVSSKLNNNSPLNSDDYILVNNRGFP